MAKFKFKLQVQVRIKTVPDCAVDRIEEVIQSEQWADCAELTGNQCHCHFEEFRAFSSEGRGVTCSRGDSRTSDVFRRECVELH